MFSYYRVYCCWVTSWQKITDDIDLFGKCVESKLAFIFDWLSGSGLSFIQSLFFYDKKSWKTEKNVVFTKTGLQLDAHLHTYMPELVTAWYKVFHSTSKVKNNDFAGVCFCSYFIVTKLRLWLHVFLKKMINIIFSFIYNGSDLPGWCYSTFKFLM